MKETELRFNNCFPPFNEKIYIGEDSKKGKREKYLAWIKISDTTTVVDVIARVASILYEESARFFPGTQQTEARAYFVSLLFEPALKKFNLKMDSNTCHKVFSNTTPKFRLEVFAGSYEEVEKFDKKNFHYRERGTGWAGHCYTKSCSRKDKTNLFVVVKTANKKGEKFTQEKVISVMAHELVHAVDVIGRYHSDLDFRTRRVLFRNLFSQILCGLDVHEEE